jgi:hypothetical protein
MGIVQPIERSIAPLGEESMFGRWILAAIVVQACFVSISAGAQQPGLAEALAEATAAPINVNCNNAQTIGSAISSAPPMNGFLQINVSGACHENVFIPPNQAVALAAAPGATLAPANTALPTINVNGILNVTGLQITATAPQAGLYVFGGRASMFGGQITGTGQGVNVSSGLLSIQNAVINVGGFSAITVRSGGILEAQGLPNAFGRNDSTFTGGSAGIFCENGQLTLSTQSGGSISVTNNPHVGLQTFGCNLAAHGTSNGLIKFSFNGTTAGVYSAGLELRLGFANLTGVQVANNMDTGINANEGASVELNGNGTTIIGNAGNAMTTSQHGVIHINSFGGANTIKEPSGNTRPLFNCFQGGKIYVNQIAGAITPTPTPAQMGCLTVGGP